MESGVPVVLVRTAAGGVAESMWQSFPWLFYSQPAMTYYYFINIGLSSPWLRICCIMHKLHLLCDDPIIFSLPSISIF